jgi:hypothetical protein
LACNSLEQKFFEAERKYEFDKARPTYRDAYIDAIEAAVAGGCYNDNVDILQFYRNKIDELKVGKE